MYLVLDDGSDFGRTYCTDPDLALRNDEYVNSTSSSLLVYGYTNGRARLVGVGAHAIVTCRHFGAPIWAPIGYRHLRFSRIQTSACMDLQPDCVSYGPPCFYFLHRQVVPLLRPPATSSLIIIANSASESVNLLTSVPIMQAEPRRKLAAHYLRPAVCS
jgi:hypothetical protein